MANVEHRTMVSADVHEPKHISDSTASDAGKVITPLSGGTSELRNLTPSEVGIQYSYGEMSVDDNTTAFAITAATDPTLHTATDFVPLNSTRITMGSENLFNGITFDNVNNTLTLTIGGVYRIGGWFNCKSNTNNTKVGVKYTLNGTATGGVLITDLAAVGREENLSGFGIVDLPAGSAIGAAIASDKSANITIEDLRINLELVRAT